MSCTSSAVIELSSSSCSKHAALISTVILGVGIGRLVLLICNIQEK